MKENVIYSDNLERRRNFFQKNFPMVKIGRVRTDINSLDILKNTCPVCGYWTLEERDAFDICRICFWEDDGIDDYDENQESGPNHMTLKQGRKIFQEAKRKVMGSDFLYDDLIVSLKEKFVRIDSIVTHNNVDKTEIIRLQNAILDLLEQNKIYGIENLFDR